MKSALIKLRETQNSMSATERAVSNYLLTHQGEAMGLSKIGRASCRERVYREV